MNMMAKAMSRPKRWSKAISDAMAVLTAERERLEEEKGEEFDAGPEKMSETAAAAVEDTLSELDGIKDEWNEWKENFPESAQSSPTYQKLEDAGELELDFDADWTFDEAQEKLEELDGFDPPRGYGRD